MRPRGLALGFTAMMISAPIARAAETGTGLTSSPSSSQRSSRRTGLITPGMPAEARTAR